jgi:hypothetical protein
MLAVVSASPSVPLLTDGQPALIRADPDLAHHARDRSGAGSDPAPERHREIGETSARPVFSPTPTARGNGGGAIRRGRRRTRALPRPPGSTLSRGFPARF